MLDGYVIDTTHDGRVRQHVCGLFKLSITKFESATVYLSNGR